MKFSQINLTTLIKLILATFFLLLTPIQSHAKDVSFEWTANPEPFIGYKLYYKTGETSAPPYDGTGLNEGSAPILLDKVTTYTVTGLSDTETYHFVLTAYDDNEESGYSALVTVTPGSSVSPIIINIKTLQ